VPLEAMAVGRPVVASGTGGSAEYLRHGENCLVYSPAESPEALAAALRDSAGAPDAICRHPDPTQPPEERYATVVSVIIDLHAHTLWISDGPPDQIPYTRITLAELAASLTTA
jgi:hypothetical protein